ADPVAYGFARSLKRPGANVTGLSYGKPELAETQIALLRSVMPQARRIMLVVPEGRNEVELAEHGILEAAAAAGIACDIAPVKTLAHVENAFTNMRVQATH